MNNRHTHLLVKRGFAIGVAFIILCIPSLSLGWAAGAGNPDTDPALKLDEPFNFSAWAEESHLLAKNVAHRGVWEGKRPSGAYNRRALRVARKRVAWGGYRLAALLNAIWP